MEGSRSAAAGAEGTAGAATSAVAVVAGEAVEATWGRCGPANGAKKGENGQKEEGGGSPVGVGASGGGEMGENAPKMRERDIPPHPPGSPRAVVGVGGKWFKKERVVDDGSVGRKGVVGDVRGWGLIVL